MLPENKDISDSIAMLLDMQKFMPNNRLKALTDAVGSKYGLNADSRELTDEELEVWAAGDLTANRRLKKPEDGCD